MDYDCFTPCSGRKIICFLTLCTKLGILTLVIQEPCLNTGGLIHKKFSTLELTGVLAFKDVLGMNLELFRSFFMKIEAFRNRCHD